MSSALAPTSSGFWALAPRLVHNVLGYKMTDPRLFTYTHRGEDRLAMVGYSEVANASTVPGIADYYVRASLVMGRGHDASLCDGTSGEDCDMHHLLGHEVHGTSDAEQCRPATRRF
eukprot:7151262-Prymnesium_polylepis.1